MPPGQGQCVEVVDLGNRVAVRDSKNPTGPALIFSAGEWSAFLAGGSGITRIYEGPPAAECGGSRCSIGEPR
ncbi:DUF397 domain-containing protein [Planosporangium sp. 12N6]|uniref:DUF397 domain-containing protein n=1 Tax=Planosporangium spinosum TaxID=3402278 RepID=UPI003CEFCCA8